MNNKQCIVIVGPTAVGKTSLAIQLAKELNTCIISADSRQCYQELNIGVAKPSAAELQTVKHYFINSHAIQDNVNAGVFEAYALHAVQEIFRHHDTAVMVGGTGLYIDAFCNGMDEVPMVSQEIRTKVESDFLRYGLSWLQMEVAEADPEYFGQGEIRNPRRLMRALEIKLMTGSSLLSFQTKSKRHRDFDLVKIGLQLSREDLYRNINHRTGIMIANGLIDEARTLMPFRELNALNTVGYKELFSYFSGMVEKDEAIELIRKNTRSYAKRQITWFKKDDSIQWFSPEGISSVKSYCKSRGIEI